MPLYVIRSERKCIKTWQPHLHTQPIQIPFFLKFITCTVVYLEVCVELIATNSTAHDTKCGVCDTFRRTQWRMYCMFLDYKRPNRCRLGDRSVKKFRSTRTCVIEMAMIAKVSAIDHHNTRSLSSSAFLRFCASRKR